MTLVDDLLTTPLANENRFRRYLLPEAKAVLDERPAQGFSH